MIFTKVLSLSFFSSFFIHSFFFFVSFIVCLSSFVLLYDDLYHLVSGRNTINCMKIEDG